MERISKGARALGAYTQSLELPDADAAYKTRGTSYLISGSRGWAITSLMLLYLAVRSLNLAERGAGPEARAMAYAQGIALAATIPLHRAARRYEQLAEEALAETNGRTYELSTRGRAVVMGTAKRRTKVHDVPSLVKMSTCGACWSLPDCTSFDRKGASSAESSENLSNLSTDVRA